MGLKEIYSEIIHWGKAGELQLLHDDLQHCIMSSSQKCSSAAALTVWGEIILGTELASGHCHFMVIYWFSLNWHKIHMLEVKMIYLDSQLLLWFQKESVIIQHLQQLGANINLKLCFSPEGLSWVP